MPEVAVFTETVTVASDVHDVAVVDQAVNESAGHDVVPEDLTPFFKALVRSQDGGGSLVAPAHELEEEHGTGAADRQVADLIHNSQRRIGERLEAMGQAAGDLGFFE